MPVPDDLSRKVVGLNRKKKNSEELNGNNNPRLDFILDNFRFSCTLPSCQLTSTSPRPANSCSTSLPLRLATRTASRATSRPPTGARSFPAAPTSSTMATRRRRRRRRWPRQPRPRSLFRLPPSSKVQLLKRR